MATTYAELVAAGICPQCRTRPAGRTRKCDECRDRDNARATERRADPVRTAANRARVLAWQQRYPAARLAKDKAYRHRLWQGALDAYGRSCACCGESEEKFLTIDHVEGGGNQHRKAVGKGGSDFYAWLRQNNYPAGFQTLCWNCNCARGLRGGCPHEQQRLAQQPA